VGGACHGGSQKARKKLRVIHEGGRKTGRPSLHVIMNIESQREYLPDSEKPQGTKSTVRRR